MKRSLLIALILGVLLMVGCGAGENAETAADAEPCTIEEVIANEAAFIAESGNILFLDEYECIEGTIFEPVRYTYVDFDADGTKEAVVSFSEFDEWMLVLHQNGDIVYGYSFDIRKLNDLKIDGTFIQSSGSDSSEYCRMEFKDGSYNIVTYADSVVEREQLPDVEWTEI